MKMAAVHWEARRAGQQDRAAGKPRDDTRWPRGVYGCADYWLGFYQGARAEGLTNVAAPAGERVNRALEQLPLFGR